MFTLLDRYLFGRYITIFLIAFLAILGLYAVLDSFSNIDNFQQTHAESGRSLIQTILEHYLYQTIFLFDIVGTSVSMVAMVGTLALLQKNGELNPILAAGIPTRRLARPFVFGILGVNAVLIINQEAVIPRISNKLVMTHSQSDSSKTNVEPLYDQQLILFSGDSIKVNEQKLIAPVITFPSPTISDLLVTIRAQEAVFFRAGKTNPAGWVIKNPSPNYDGLKLTAFGKEYIKPLTDPNSFFIVTDVTLDQLSNRNKSFRFLSTFELYQRIVNQSNSPGMTTSQLIMFHNRLLRPWLNLIGVFLVLPLIVPKESRNLLVDMFSCMSILGVIMFMGMSVEFISKTGLVSPEFAACIPVVFSACLATWLYSNMRS
jgi:lipopolysaccharide export system permease protein